MRKKIKKWFIKLLAESWIGEEISAYWSEQAQLKDWYKARRAGYKKSDMGFYYSDLQRN